MSMAEMAAQLADQLIEGGVDGVVLICIKKGEEVGGAVAGPEFPLDSLVAIAVQTIGEIRRDMINDNMAKEPVVEMVKTKKPPVSGGSSSEGNEPA